MFPKVLDDFQSSGLKMLALEFHFRNSALDCPFTEKCPATNSRAVCSLLETISKHSLKHIKTSTESQSMLADQRASDQKKT